MYVQNLSWGKEHVKEKEGKKSEWRKELKNGESYKVQVFKDL